ncbi:MAG TPA: hypothetical protein VGD00_10355 [Solirubrobacteraceae bacterium]
MHTSEQAPSTRSRTSSSALTAAAVGLGGALALALLAALVRHEPTPRGDDLIYERIALHPFATHTFPFGYRIGLPLLVHLLPLGTGPAFYLLALAAAAGAGAFAYLLMRRLGSDARVAAVLALLMCVSPPFLIVLIREGRNTDIATVMLMMAATYFLVCRAYWKLAAVLLLGVVVREALLFVLPLAYAVWAERPLDRRAAAWTLAVGAPAAAAYIALRLGLQTVGEGSVPGYGGSLLGERFTVIKEGLRTPFREARRMFTVYGPLWLVAPPALRGMRFARRGLVLVALCVVAMTFALDWGRMILLAAPVFYPAAAFVLTRHPRWRAPVYAAMLALAVGYAIYMDHSGVQSGIIENGLPPYPVR